MPVVHTEITIWGAKGGPPHFCLEAKSYFFGYLERQAKIQNRRQIPSGGKVSGRKERKRKKKNDTKFSGHYVRQRMDNVLAHALRSDKLCEAL